MIFSRPDPRKPAETVPADERVLSLPLSVKTRRRQLPVFTFRKVRIVKAFFGKISIRKVLVLEVSVVELSVGEVPLVEGHVPYSETSHPRRPDAEFVSELLVS